jgi:hypothetical protein
MLFGNYVIGLVRQKRIFFGEPTVLTAVACALSDTLT